MKIYKYNKETLLFEETNVLKQSNLNLYGLFSVFVLVSFLAAYSLFMVKDLQEQLDKKQEIIEILNNPLPKDSTYTDNLKKIIGFKLTEEQDSIFNILSLKYRDDIEKAHIPATLVWWVFYKESGFNVNAKNSKSSAKGLGQMIDKTWNLSCKMAGEDNSGRFDEKKQVRITLVYLNYLYNKYGDWKQSMNEYHGGKYHYPVNFLLK